jgi:hypothetical protein
MINFTKHDGNKYDNSIQLGHIYVQSNTSCNNKMYVVCVHL